MTVAALLMRSLYDVFGERDRTRRASAIAALFEPDCRFSDPRGTCVGHAELDHSVVALQAEYPGYLFSATGQAEAVGECGRLAWQFGPADDPARVSGLDVIIARGPRISALYTFIDKEI